MAIIQINIVRQHIIKNPYGEAANGTPPEFTFIPYNPEITVGIAMINVITVKDFMTLFNRLSTIEDNNSLVPLIISL